MKKPLYYSLATNDSEANLSIYGDITSYPLSESDVSSYNLSAQLAALEGVKHINVYINSYGGEVSEGLAIYNALKRHSAKVTTYCDGMACSIASVIFMAGDERVMSKASLLMIHNAWTMTMGNAEELRKQADDLDKITSASIAAYMTHAKISKPKLKRLMDAETWLTPKEAISMGFASQIADDDESGKPSQSARKRAFELFLQSIAFKNAEGEEDEPETPDDESIEDEDEDAENAPDEPENATDEDEASEDDETSEDEPDKDETDEEKEQKPDEAAQRWSGFFNAIYRA